MTERGCHLTRSVGKMDELMDYALFNSIKYKFDPVIGKIHQDYLNAVKEIMKKLEKEGFA